MTNEQRIKQIEAELASLKVDLAMEPPTLERQEHDHVNDALNYQQGKKDWEILEFGNESRLFKSTGNGAKPGKH